MLTEAEIQQRIAEEQAKIDVPSYQDVALDGAWKRRSSAMWGLSALGAAFGAGFGVIAAGLAAFGGSPVAFLELLGNSVAIFTATGLSAGLATGVVVGSPAGAAASAAKEIERRTLAREIEQKIRDNPEAKVQMHETPAPVRREPFRLSDYFNIKTALVFAAIGTVGGLIMAAAFAAAGGLAAGASSSVIASYAMPAMHTLLGTATPTATALAIYSGGMGMAFGAFFGVNVPKMARYVSNLGGGLLSGKAIGAPWPKSANLPEQKPILTPVVEPPEQAVEQQPNFADKVKRPQSHEALVLQAIKEAENCGCHSRN